MSIIPNKPEEQEPNPHVCGQPTMVFSRVCGYYRPVSNWNIGKKEEFKERLVFNVNTNRYLPQTDCGCSK